MNLFAKFRRNQNGAAAIEFALAAPLILLLFYGMGQFGVILLANAGIRHAVDTGARAATVYVGSTPMSDVQIQDVVTNSLYGTNGGTVSTPTVTRGTSNGANYVDITLSYSVPVRLIVYEYGPIVLSETRRAYLP
jgi:Flp pilus assembly protein TadG